MPLTWAQVKAGLDPSKFDVRSVPGLLKGLKAWSDYDEGGRSLAEAIGRLGAARGGK
jgi:bifunctional non-homologous end joining protein LigD